MCLVHEQVSIQEEAMTPRIKSKPQLRRIPFFVIVALMMILSLSIVPGAGALDPVDPRPFDSLDTFVASNFATSTGAELGRSVAVSGDTVVLGAPDENSETGAVYVYVRPLTGWSGAAQTIETAKLTVDGMLTYERLGISVAISGDTIVVGADGDEGNRGAAYVFVKPEGGWASTNTPTARLNKEAASQSAFDYFGISVAISGDYIVAGAPGSNGNGEAFVFVRPTSGWEDAEPDAILSDAGGGGEDDFGGSVAIHADTVVVGARLADVAGSEVSRAVALAHREALDANADQGQALVFTMPPDTGWMDDSTPDAALTSASGGASDWFGESVDIREDGLAIVVGAQAADRPSFGDAAGKNETNEVAAIAQGAAYVFMKPSAGWGDANEDAVLSSGSTGQDSDLFGHSVSISGDTIVVGAPQFRTDDTAPDDKQGAAFVYLQPNVTLGTELANSWLDTDTADTILSLGVAGADEDEFGASVSVDGGTLVAGIPFDDVPLAAASSIEEVGEDIVINQGSASLFVNEYCTKITGGAWNSAETWVGGSVPLSGHDVCVSSGHTVTMDMPSSGTSPEVVLPDAAVRRLLVNPGAVLNLDALTVDVNEAVTNNGTMIQKNTQFGDTAELLWLETDGSGTVFRGADVTSDSDLGEIVLTLRSAIDWVSPTAVYAYCTSDGSESPPYVTRCFDIAPAVKDQESQVTLWALLTELNGVVVDDLAGFHFAGSTFTALTSNDVGDGSLGIGYVSVTGTTTSFSEFLIGDRDLGPTAIDLVNLAANGASSPIFLLFSLVTVLALATIGLLAFARRKGSQT